MVRRREQQRLLNGATNSYSSKDIVIIKRGSWCSNCFIWCDVVQEERQGVTCCRCSINFCSSALCIKKCSAFLLNALFRSQAWPSLSYTIGVTSPHYSGILGIFELFAVCLNKWVSQGYQSNKIRLQLQKNHFGLIAFNNRINSRETVVRMVEPETIPTEMTYSTCFMSHSLACSASLTHIANT